MINICSYKSLYFVNRPLWVFLYHPIQMSIKYKYFHFLIVIYGYCMKRIFRFTVIQWISVSSKHFTISFITSYSWDCDNNLIPNSFWSIKMTLIQRVFLKKITDWVFVAALESPHSTREIELQDSRAESWEGHKQTENLRRVEIGCIKCENCQYLFKIIVDWYKTNNLLPGFLSELCSVLTHITGVPLWSFLPLNVYKYHEVIILRCVALTLSNSPHLRYITTEVRRWGWELVV